MKKSDKNDFKAFEISDGTRSEKLRFDESIKKEKIDKTNEQS
jgi:hypothetical protein